MEDNIPVLELTIPKDVENLKLPSPETLDFYQVISD